MIGIYFARRKGPHGIQLTVQSIPFAPRRLDPQSFTLRAADRTYGGKPFSREAMSTQGEFDFAARTGTGQGYTQWLAGRRLTASEMARRMNLPIGHQVEVWLYGNVRLRGKLRLKEELLFIDEERVRHLELMVDHVPFAYREIESCVRLD